VLLSGYTQTYLWLFALRGYRLALNSQNGGYSHKKRTGLLIFANQDSREGFFANDIGSLRNLSQKFEQFS